MSDYNSDSALKTEYISNEEFLKFNNGNISYSEISDSLIEHFLENELELTEDHPLIKGMDEDALGEMNHDEVVYHTKKIVHNVKLLQAGKTLNPFEIWYEGESEYPEHPRIYQGWNRIRAYQYMGFEEIPCLVIQIY